MREANEIKFGIEFECYIPYEVSRAISQGTRSHPRAVPGMPDGWKSKTDGSITGGAPSGYTGVEFMSEPMSGVEGLNSVKKACEWLQNHRTRVNKKCGVHIHIHWTAPQLKTLKRLVYLVSNHEDALYGVTGSPHRKFDTIYSRPIKGKVKTGRWTTSRTTIPGHVTDRYQTLNLQNLLNDVRPTVEFRVFAGTINPLKMVTYIQMCIGLVQKAERCKKTATADYLPANTNTHRDRWYEWEVSRFFSRFGWKKSPLRNDGSPAFPTLGLIEGCEYSVKSMMKEAKRLAKKFQQNMTDNHRTMDRRSDGVNADPDHSPDDYVTAVRTYPQGHDEPIVEYGIRIRAAATTAARLRRTAGLS